MSLAWQGIGVASERAIAIGPAFVDVRGHISASPVFIETEAIPAELERFTQAVASARASLAAIREQTAETSPLKAAEFIDIHIMMLDDQTLIGAVRDLIAKQRCSAEWALQQHCDRLLQWFDEMDDAYLRTRRDDVEHVVQQVQAVLRGRAPAAALAPRDLHGHIVVARDISPADAIVLHQRGAVAFITERGGPMSHTAILARSLGVPAVVGAHNVTRTIQPDEPLIVDGMTGNLIAGADQRALAFFRRRQHDLEKRRRGLRRLVGRPTLTRDGMEIELFANVELAADVALATASDATGIGLYRTEFLYMNRSTLPDEEQHLATYSKMVRKLSGMPLTIRTLDLGADKQSEALPAAASGAANPALGLRALRLCLREQELFRPQLRAILRASALGPVRLMLPMVSNVRELDAALDIIQQIKRELDRQELAYDPMLPIGAMIEVPAAALAARAIAQRVDFMSIGTNDLIQYTLAIDRLDDAVNHLFDPTHAAVLRLIRMTIDAGRASNCRVSMCGEMAGDPRFTRLLLGLGLREFSMQSGAILAIKEIVLDADTARLRRLCAELFARLDDEDPSQLLDTLNARAVN